MLSLDAQCISTKERSGADIYEDISGLRNVSNISPRLSSEPFWYSQTKDLPYYHGILPRNYVAHTFKLNGCQNGDFILRESHVSKESEHVDTILVLSVFWQKLHHFHLASKSDSSALWFCSSSKSFDGVQELISHYLDSGSEFTDGIRLRRALCREAGFLMNEWVEVTPDAVLGEGAYGTVHFGKFRSPSTKKPISVGIKIVKPRLDVITKGEKEAFVKEARMLQKCRHPNVVRIIGIAASKDPIMMVLELCFKGTLFDYIYYRGSNLSLPELFRFALETSSGMHFLSSKGVIHCDLASDNILVNAEGALKISDFGAAIECENQLDRFHEYPRASHCFNLIPLRWSAPETVIRNVFSFATDVWSYGALLYEIFSLGDRPWPDCESDEQVRDTILADTQHPLPKAMPVNFYNKVMRRCLAFEARRRPSFSGIKALIDSFSSSLNRR